MKRILLPASVFPTLIFVSCQKEITGDKEVQLNCKIANGQYVQPNGINDSAQFIYDEWGRVIKWKNSTGHYDYLYSGANIQTLTYKNNSTSDLLYLDSVIYNQDNSISEIRFYDYTQLPYSLKHHNAVFIYNNSQLSSVMKITYPETKPDTLMLNLTWNAQGNVDRIVSAAKGGVIVENITFEYNTSANYFRSIHPQFFLFDPHFGLNDDFEWQIAFYVSQNSVTRINRNGSIQNLGYYFDNKNKLTVIDVGNNRTNYSYQCQ